MFNINTISQSLSAFKRRSALGWVLVAMLGLGTSAAVLANPHLPEPGQMMRHMAKELGLTDSQKQQIKALFESQKQTREQHAAAFNEQRSKMDALIKADVFDEVAFTTLQQSMMQQHAQLGLARAKTQHQIWQLLTPEQREQFELMQQQRDEKRAARREAKQEKRDAMRHSKSDA